VLSKGQSLHVDELRLPPLETVEEIGELRVAQASELADGGVVAGEEVLVRLPCLVAHDLAQL
jgi:hypothetical protein